jgi:hypothetical protein
MQTGITNARTEGTTGYSNRSKTCRMRIPKSRKFSTPDMHPHAAGRDPDFMLITQSKSKSR